MKQMIRLQDYAGKIQEEVGKGVLLTTGAGEKTDTMTIGWGTLGIQWGKPIFIAFVRETRFTKSLLDQNPEFTVNIPMTGDVGEILKYCGTRSGRDTDKFADLGLTAVPGDTVSVPGIRELPLTLECKVIYRQKQDLHAICPSYAARYYDGKNAEDVHTAYYGEITAAYLIED